MADWYTCAYCGRRYAEKNIANAAFGGDNFLGDVLHAGKAIANHAANGGLRFCSKSCKKAYEQQNGSVGGSSSSSSSSSESSTPPLTAEEKAKDLEAAKEIRRTEIPDDVNELQTFIEDQCDRLRIEKKDSRYEGTISELKRLIKKAMKKYKGIADKSDYKKAVWLYTKVSGLIWLYGGALFFVALVIALTIVINVG